ncbi:protein amalgam-like [Galendromus occidentalis]|uniref:Protein amalgam-like n=1 Tax=Galendromus occidentalis TaxID=34638 RepID=A0AAJ7WHE6_9ACAR|nr:protein amalgam-like [Galendromus occidentalis]
MYVCVFLCDSDDKFPTIADSSVTGRKHDLATGVLCQKASNLYELRLSANDRSRVKEAENSVIQNDDEFRTDGRSNKLANIISRSLTSEPEFAEEIKNVSVSVGRRVTLSCVVNNLGNYRVAWLYVEKYTLLTLAKAVITHSNRFKVTHNGHRTWNLIVSDVQVKDKGAYMCQINTSPMKFQVGYLDVVVPPSIREDLTSSDVEVKEGSDVSLYCAASGTPEPTVQWRREDSQDIMINDYRTNVVKGPWLNITKVSRLHMGAYICIAQNSVQPSMSKRIKLDVLIAPMIWLTDQILGKSVGSNARLRCNLEGHPRGDAHWTRNGDLLRNRSRFSEEIQQLGPYKHAIVLEIKNVRPEDFGEYHCFAKNPFGETEATLKVYGKSFEVH